jgi:hypothetical protein
MINAAQLRHRCPCNNKIAQNRLYKDETSYLLKELHGEQLHGDLEGP